MSSKFDARAVRSLAALVGLKIAVTLLAFAVGFRAISDDDFARVVIAQRFAETPALDPTGTSWLPLPFWTYGAVFTVFGSSLGVARVTAGALGIISVLLIWAAARWRGASPRAAFLSAALAGIFPYSAVLGAATVPELPTAALILFSVTTLTLRGARERWFGALAVTAACASRYEAWPVALVFAGVTLWDAILRRDVRLATAALVATSFPALWIAHGAVQHGDAWFFVRRVTAYRAALGGAPLDATRALVRPVITLIAREPELVFGAFLAAGCVARSGERPSRALDWSRIAVALGALLAFVMVGEARGSGPTHHGERALVALWLALALWLGCSLDALLTLAPAPRLRALLGVGLGALAIGFTFRVALPREPFTERRDEVTIGAAAREHNVERLLIQAPDFGYFAVQAAFGGPGRTVVVDDRDPRKHRQPRLDADGLALAAENAGARWIALHRSETDPHALGAVRARSGEWALLELAPVSPRSNPEPR